MTRARHRQTGGGRTGGILLGGLVLLVSAPTPGTAQAPAPDPVLKVSAVVGKSVYLLDPTQDPSGQDPIRVVVSVVNPLAPAGAGGASDPNAVLTSEGFLAERFHLFLDCRDPNGKRVIAFERVAEGEGANPLVLEVDGKLVPVAPAEAVPPQTTKRTIMPEMRAYYPLTTAGFWSCRLAKPFVRYTALLRTVGGIPFVGLTNDVVAFGGQLESRPPLQFALVADGDGDGTCFPVADVRLCADPRPDCNDGNPAVHPGAPEVPNNGIDDDCDAATVDVPAGPPPGTLLVEAIAHVVQGVGNKPPVTREPIPLLPVRVFDTGPGSCVDQTVMGKSWRQFPTIWRECPTLPELVRLTSDPEGEASCMVPSGKKHLVIGEYPPGAGLPKVYIGSHVGRIAPAETRQTTLRVIVDGNGDPRPAKVKRWMGSELSIVQPEYIEWDSRQELYPFVLESEGDWTVRTRLKPPKGFVADVKTLTEEVTAEVEAVQFTLTDRGTNWTYTTVTYELKQKRKKEKIKSKIGIKLSMELAEEKNLTIYGEKKETKRKKDKQHRKERKDRKHKDHKNYKKHKTHTKYKKAEKGKRHANELIGKRHRNDRRGEADD